MIQPSIQPSRASLHGGALRPHLAARLALAALAALALPACSDDGDSCGPSVQSGEVVAADRGSSGVALRYHQLRARRNNDCPAADAPAGVISVTISGVATDGTAPFTLCVGRPDLLSGARALGGAGAQVEVVDVSGAAGGCTFRQKAGAPATGTVTSSGVCGDAVDPAGFSMKFNGEVTVERTCGATVDTLTLSLTGEVPVSKSDT